MSTKHASVITIVQVDAEEKEVACDGGGVMGHPLVYLPFGKKNSIVCYYCGKRFQRRSSEASS